jgi:hypothetical protein
LSGGYVAGRREFGVADPVYYGFDIDRPTATSTETFTELNEAWKAAIRKRLGR